MRRVAFVLIVGLALASGLVPAAPRAAAVSGRAVYERDHADPDILRADDGRYYAFATGRRRGSVRQNVPVMTSTDLTHWTELGDALWSLGTWAGSGPTWAPSVAEIGDQYVLFYTAARAGVSPRQLCIGRAVSATPNGPYVDRWRSPLVCPTAPEYEAIDPSVFVDSDGRAYLHYKTSATVGGKNTTRIWGFELSADATERAGDPVPVLDPTLAWEEGDVENPEMIAVDGTYWLLYAGSWWDTDRYATGAARCESPLGGCVKRGRVLESDDARTGPGGASLVTDRAGGWWIVYHAWVNRTRMLFVDALDVWGEQPAVDAERLSPRTLPATGSLDRVKRYESYV